MSKVAQTWRFPVYSLQSFIILPLIKISSSFGLPLILCYLTSLIVPTIALKTIATIRGNIFGDYYQPGHQNRTRSRYDLIIAILCSGLLGLVFKIGLTFVDASLEPHFVPLGFYMILLATFHFSEYFVTSITNPATLTASSFLIDQSSAYVIAITSSFAEYLIEAYFMPDFKKFNVISMFGLLMAIIGEIIRKVAMFTAGENFTHFISVTKSPEHKLVTHGIYSIFRHPSYAGWFYWAIGSQILLLNPICIILFAVISYKFFKDRIIYEEALLVKFFKEDYLDYKKRVPLRMPIFD